MTATEFNELPYPKKADMWSKNGVFLDERIIYGKCKIVIYSVFNFYVEVYYNVNTNQIGTVKALENIEDFEGYLKSVQLELLY